MSFPLNQGNPSGHVSDRNGFGSGPFFLLMSLDFEAVPELDDNSGGRYSAQLSDALGSQYPVRDGDGTLADWNVDFDPNAPVDPTPESVDPVSDIP